jgi:hypothetical protein
LSRYRYAEVQRWCRVVGAGVVEEVKRCRGAEGKV